MNKILMSIIAASAIFSNTSTIYANDIAVNNKIEEKEVTENEYLQNIDNRYIVCINSRSIRKYS